jgi:hypothetical protein
VYVPHLRIRGDVEKNREERNLKMNFFDINAERRYMEKKEMTLKLMARSSVVNSRFRPDTIISSAVRYGRLLERE